MRIIIELDEKEGMVPSIHIPTAITSMETVDGGAPSEMLVQAITETFPPFTEKEGMDGGSPPEWLMMTVQNSVVSEMTGSAADIDAGSAPQGV